MKLWAFVPGLVLVAGLVLPVWALFVEPPAGVPGLSAFPSAFLGDTLLIPLSMLLIVGAIRSRAPTPSERRFAVTAAGAATVVACAVQASWLHDRHPRLNWTLPRPGHFTVAGWWHAFYFVALSALFAGLIAILLRRVSGERRYGARLSAGPWTSTFFIATGTYLALAVHDSTGGKVGWASGSSLTLIGIALVSVGALTGLALGRSFYVLLRPALVGLAGAASLTALAVGPGLSGLRFTATAAVALFTAALALVYDMLNTRDSPVGAVDSTISVLTTAGLCSASWLALSHEAARHELARTLATAGVAILLLSILMIGILGRRAVWTLVFTALYVFALGVATTAVWLDVASSAAADYVPYVAMAVGVLLAIATKVVQVYTDHELGVPDDVSQESQRQQESQVGRRSTLALVLIVVFGLGAFMATLAFTLAANRDASLPRPIAYSEEDKQLLQAVVLALILALVVFAVGPRRHQQTWIRWVTWLITVVLPVGLSVLLLTAVIAHPVQSLASLTAAAAGLVAALWTANSVLGNVWLLQGRSFSVTGNLSAISLSVFSGSVVAWILTAGTRTDRGGRGLVQAIAVVTVALLLMIALTTLLGGTASRGLSYRTELPPWRGLLQDGFSVSAIVLIIVFPSGYMISNVGAGDGLKLSVPLALLFAAPFYWIMKANRDWPEIEARRLLSADEVTRVFSDMGERSWQRFKLDLRTQRKYRTHPIPREHSEEFIRALAAHTRNQNRLAAAMLVTPLVGALLGIGLCIDSGQFSELLRKLTRPPIASGNRS